MSVHSSFCPFLLLIAFLFSSMSSSMDYSALGQSSLVRDFLRQKGISAPSWGSLLSPCSDHDIPSAVSHSFCSLLFCLFIPIFKLCFPEASQFYQLGPAMPCVGAIGPIWNCLCLAWGSPGLSPLRCPAALLLALGHGHTVQGATQPPHKASSNLVLEFWQIRR